MAELSAVGEWEVATTSQTRLVRKLAAVMVAVDRIPKRGRNDFHKYDYATEADIVEAIRKELGNRNVMLFTSVTSEDRIDVGKTSSGNAKTLTRIEMVFTFIDGESGEQIERTWRGAGIDTEDKGLYKAMTGGEKYFLLKTFLIPTGDDPEESDEKKEQAAPRAAPKPIKQAVKKAVETVQKVQAGQAEQLKTVQRVDVKDGMKGQRPWKRWDVYFSDGSKASTFEPERGLRAEDLKGKLVGVDLETTDKGINLLGIWSTVGDDPMPDMPYQNDLGVAQGIADYLLARVHDEPVTGPEHVLTVRVIPTPKGNRWEIQTDKRVLLTDSEVWAALATQTRKEKRGVLPQFEVVPKPGGGSVNKLTLLEVVTDREPGADDE